MGTSGATNTTISLSKVAVNVNQNVTTNVPAQPDQRQCRIATGPVAWSAQLVLLTVVLSALLLKRHRERPRRAWNVWSLDIGKQAISSGAGHACGMAIAILAASATASASECCWYIIVYLLDSTQGITLAIIFHRLTHRFARSVAQGLPTAMRPEEEDEGSGGGGSSSSSKDHGSGSGGRHWSNALLESGNYGDPVSLKRWAIQSTAWMLCVVVARSTVGVTILLGKRLFEILTASIEARFRGHPDALLFTVMVAIPLTLNIGLAWIQDAVLKWKSTRRLPGRRTVTTSAGVVVTCQGSDGGEGDGGGSAMVGVSGTAAAGGEPGAIGAQQLASVLTFAVDRRARASDKPGSSMLVDASLRDDL
ncbi:MAG: hypothetical protein WDW38_010218 [Sanguina aurantia]